MGRGSKALLDDGAQINTITPNYVKNHSLEIGLITDPKGTTVACMGLGNAYTWPLGYIIVWVEVDRVQGYDEEQIALAVPDESKFAECIPIMNVIKERGNRCLDNAMGGCQGGASLIHV